MALINITTPSDGETADAADVATPLNTIVSEFNGNIDNANIKSGAAIATAKLASDAGITSAMLGADSVTATKIDWASTGADGGIWWEEIGRTTLGSAGDTITVSGLPARKYLKILIFTYTSGAITNTLRFNDDTGTNYSRRASSNGGAESTATSANEIQVSNSGSSDMLTEAFVINVASRDKLVIASSVQSSGAASGAPNRYESTGLWDNSTDAISSVTAYNTGAGSYDTGSEVVVLGHN